MKVNREKYKSEGAKMKSTVGEQVREDEDSRIYMVLLEGGGGIEDRGTG